MPRTRYCSLHNTSGIDMLWLDRSCNSTRLLHTSSHLPEEIYRLLHDLWQRDSDSAIPLINMKPSRVQSKRLDFDPSLHIGFCFHAVLGSPSFANQASYIKTPSENRLEAVPFLNAVDPQCRVSIASAQPQAEIHRKKKQLYRVFNVKRAMYETLLTLWCPRSQTSTQFSSEHPSPCKQIKPRGSYDQVPLLDVQSLMERFEFAGAVLLWVKKGYVPLRSTKP